MGDKQIEAHFFVENSDISVEDLENIEDELVERLGIDILSNGWDIIEEKSSHEAAERLEYSENVRIVNTWFGPGRSLSAIEGSQDLVKVAHYFSAFTLLCRYLRPCTAAVEKRDNTFGKNNEEFEWTTPNCNFYRSRWMNYLPKSRLEDVPVKEIEKRALIVEEDEEGICWLTSLGCSKSRYEQRRDEITEIVQKHIK